MTNVTINGVEYAPINNNLGTKIVVADRGWVFIGVATKNDDVGVELTKANVIRRWGTDTERPGLGWLALHGKTENTILEPTGMVFVPRNSIVAVIDVVAEWEL